MKSAFPFSMSLMRYGALFISVMSELPYTYCPHVSLVATSIAWAKERQEWKTQTSAVRRTTGQSWRMLLAGRQGRAASGFGKNHPRPEGLRYFSRKPCLSGSIRRRALVVQRAAKARAFTLKITRLCDKQSSQDKRHRPRCGCPWQENPKYRYQNLP